MANSARLLTWLCVTQRMENIVHEASTRASHRLSGSSERKSCGRDMHSMGQLSR